MRGIRSPGRSPVVHARPLSRALVVALAGLCAVISVGLLPAAPAAAATRPASFTPVAPVDVTAAPALSVPSPFDWLFEHMVANPFRTQERTTLKVAIDASEASFLTPALTNDSRVTQLWQLLLEISDSVLLLLVIVGAVMVVAGDWTYLEAKALAPRVIAAGVAMNLSLLVVGLAISWSNDVVKGFLSLGNASLTPAVTNVVSTVRTPIVLALLLIVVLILLLANLLRLVIVLVITVGAPLMNVFGVLPATDGITRAWWRALAATLIAPVVQALLLVVGVWITLSSGSPFQSVFDNPAWSGLVDSTMLLAIVLLMALSPLWMFKHALGGEGHRHFVNAVRWGRRAVGVGI